MENKLFWRAAGSQAAAVALALAVTTAVLLAAGAPPLRALREIAAGAFGSAERFSNVLVAWVPLAIVTAGLLVTFSAGLWNIGIEGQITMGAIATTWCLRCLPQSGLPPPLVIALGIAAGVAGGALWAALAGGLKTFGGVNEIFGGLGLNYIATALTLWLIFGPWKRPGIGSMSGTEPFDARLWLPQIPHSRLSVWALGLGMLSIILVYVLLRSTSIGLKMKAVGKNIRAAFILGIPSTRFLLSAFILCGCLGGLAGGLQVTAVYHRLIPSISSGYGYLGLLVAMLVNYRAAWAAPVALLFAALNIGGIELPIVLQLDSSLSGVVQGVLVLAVVMVQGVRARMGNTS